MKIIEINSTTSVTVEGNRVTLQQEDWVDGILTVCLTKEELLELVENIN